MRQSGAGGRGLSTGDPTRRVRTGRTRVVLMAVFGLLLAVLSPLVIAASPASALDVTEPTTTVISVSPAEVIYPGAVTFSAKVTGNFPVPNAANFIDVTPGSVAFTSGLIPICTASLASVSAGEVGGSCSATTVNLPLGLQTITGSYSGGTACACAESEGWFLGPSSDTTTLTVDAPVSIPAPTPTPPPVVTSPTTSNHGYWLVGSDGGIFTFGNAQFYGSTGNLSLQRPVVGITPTGSQRGYWLVASDGGIFSFGNAGFYGSIPGLDLAPAGSGLPHSLNAPIVGMVPSADGNGYFMVGADGGVFTFGDAKFEGSCPSIGGCAGGAAVAVMPDSTGNGYWVVTAGGDVTAFGDAPSPGEPGVPGVVAAVRSYDGHGYYILYSNGVVYSAGDAVNYGNATGSVGGSNPASAIFTTADGGGYWVASANGSVFTYGDAPYLGGANELHLNGGIIAGTGW